MRGDKLLDDRPLGELCTCIQAGQNNRLFLNKNFTGKMCPIQKDQKKAGV